MLKEYLHKTTIQCPHGEEGCYGKNIHSCQIKTNIEKKEAFVAFRLDSKAPKNFLHKLIGKLPQSDLLKNLLISLFVGLLLCTGTPLIIKEILNFFTTDNFLTKNHTISGFIITSLVIFPFFIFIILNFLNKRESHNIKIEILDQCITVALHIAKRARIVSKNKKINKEIISSSYESFVNCMEMFFSRKKNNEKITCAIRIINEEMKEYITCARSSSMSEKEANSTGICADRGIPKFFNDSAKDSVVICNDHEYVLKCPFLIQKNENHKNYINSEKSILAAPIITRFENKNVVGIIFICCNIKNAFTEHDALKLKYISNLISFYIHHIYSITEEYEENINGQ